MASNAAPTSVFLNFEAIRSPSLELLSVRQDAVEAPRLFDGMFCKLLKNNDLEETAGAPS
jgi:hypothetical protein